MRACAHRACRAGIQAGISINLQNDLNDVMAVKKIAWLSFILALTSPALRLLVKYITPYQNVCTGNACSYLYGRLARCDEIGRATYVFPCTF